MTTLKTIPQQKWGPPLSFAGDAEISTIKTMIIILKGIWGYYNTNMLFQYFTVIQGSNSPEQLMRCNEIPNNLQVTGW